VRLLYSFSHYYKFTTQIHKERELHSSKKNTKIV
jgi:hypothetical protein